MRAAAMGLGTGVEARIRVSPQRGDFDSTPTPRRGRSVRRSRRGLQAKRLKIMAVTLVLATGTTAVVTWLMVSPRFAVRELSVSTGERVPVDWVREALAPMLGANLPRLPLAHAEQILRDHPWVQGADLRKDLPARLAVRVTERQAVALLRGDDGLHYLDSDGVRITPFDPTAERAMDLPLISHGSPSRLADTASATLPTGPGSQEATALRSAIELLSEIDEAEPFWTAGLSEIEILGGDDFRIHTSYLPFPVLVKAGTLHQKARRLEELLPHIERYGAAAVDLRFARRIILQPSVKRGAGRSRPIATRPAPMTEHQEATTDHAQRG